MSEVCPNCDAALPPGVVMSLAAAHSESPPPAFVRNLTPDRDDLIPVTGIVDASHHGEVQPFPSESSGLRPWLAAGLSLFCGLGQLYNGQILKGIVLMILGAVAILSWPSLASKIAIPALWGFAIVDAFRQARPRRH